MILEQSKTVIHDMRSALQPIYSLLYSLGKTKNKAQKAFLKEKKGEFTTAQQSYEKLRITIEEFADLIDDERDRIKRLHGAIG